MLSQLCRRFLLQICGTLTIIWLFSIAIWIVKTISSDGPQYINGLRLSSTHRILYAILWYLYGSSPVLLCIGYCMYSIAKKSIMLRRGRKGQYQFTSEPPYMPKLLGVPDPILGIIRDYADEYPICRKCLSNITADIEIETRWSEDDKYRWHISCDDWEEMLENVDMPYTLIYFLIQHLHTSDRDVHISFDIYNSTRADMVFAYKRIDTCISMDDKLVDDQKYIYLYRIKSC